MNSMAGKVFIDANLFVYASLEAVDDVTKREKVIDFLQEIEDDIVISTQIINEFYSVMLKNKVPDSDIQEKLLEIIEDTEVQVVDLNTIRRGWQVKEKYLYSYWDSLIISSALESGCKILYSEDMHHDQVIEDTLRIVNPFL